MIADAHLDIHREETHSSGWLTDMVFYEANFLDYRRYFLDRSMAVEDDHVPFLELGIPSVDLIDLDYGPFKLYWHTRFDTVDKCSPASTAVVGEVILRSLEELENLFRRKQMCLLSAPEPRGFENSFLTGEVAVGTHGLGNH